jgi:hypothetical protein
MFGCAIIGVIIEVVTLLGSFHNKLTGEFEIAAIRTRFSPLEVKNR